MTGLPLALASPEDGCYRVETAVSIWLQVAYGLPYGTPNASRDYRLAWSDAHRALRPLVRSATIREASVVRVELDPWGNPHEIRQRRIVRTWIEQADLIAFAAEHGVELFAETAATMPDKALPGRKPNPATTLAFELRPQASSDREAATKAVDKFYSTLHEDVKASKRNSIERALRRKREQ